jgi:hypothetical protein
VCVKVYVIKKTLMVEENISSEESKNKTNYTDGSAYTTRFVRRIFLPRNWAVTRLCAVAEGRSGGPRTMRSVLSAPSHSPINASERRQEINSTESNVQHK